MKMKKRNLGGNLRNVARVKRILEPLAMLTDAAQRIHDWYVVNVREFLECTPLNLWCDRADDGPIHPTCSPDGLIAMRRMYDRCARRY